MTCPRCRIDNPNTNKFCGQCGTALPTERRAAESERRQAQRRAESERRQGVLLPMSPRQETRGSEQRNESPGPVAVPQPPAGAPYGESTSAPSASVVEQQLAAGQAQDRSDVPGKTVARPVNSGPEGDERQQLEARQPIDFAARRDSSNISGPSFLGLGGNNDSADYLLEEEDTPRGSGWRKLAVLAVFAVILVLLAMQWRATYQAKSINLPPASAGSSPEEKRPAEAEPQKRTDEADPRPQTNEAETPKSGGETDIPPRAENQSPRPMDEERAAELRGPTQERAGNGHAEGPGDAAEEGRPAEELTTADRELLTRAENYLHGRNGAQQNCEQGLALLEAAARRPNPRAHVKMAALYATGLCVAQDRVQAYRWFSRALELEPRNPYIQRSRSSVVASMSPEEREKITPF